jgi:hypothetical protein
MVKAACVTLMRVQRAELRRTFKSSIHQACIRFTQQTKTYELVLSTRSRLRFNSHLSTPYTMNCSLQLLLLNNPQCKNPLPARLLSHHRLVHLAYPPVLVPAAAMLPLPARLPELAVRSSSRHFHPRATKQKHQIGRSGAFNIDILITSSTLPFNEASSLGSTTTTPPRPIRARAQSATKVPAPHPHTFAHSLAHKHVLLLHQRYTQDATDV